MEEGMSRTDRNTGFVGPEEQFSAADRRSYQEKWLREVINHAYDSGTPLKQAMDGRGLTAGDIQTAEDLEKIPVTTKNDLKEAQAKNPPFGGFCTVPSSDLMRIHQSPGPIYDPVGRVPDYFRWKSALFATGFRPGDIVVNTFAYHLTPAGHMFEDGAAALGLTVVPTGVGNTETQVQVIKDLGITGYVGTPSFFNTILKKAEDMGLRIASDLKLEIALLLAEMLPESMRKKFIDEYGIIARQAYGTADIGCVTYECPQESGMHIHEDVIIEIVDPQTGKNAPMGEPGEVVVTCNNMIYPLVRFGTGDLSAMTAEECPCGRTAPRLTRIMGRVDQVTKVKGMFVHPSQVEKVAQSHPEIVKARLLVERPQDSDLMTLEIEVTGEPGAELVASVEQSIKEILKLRGAVRILESGTLQEGHKTIEDVRKWD
jgi:phenylacetate-CoA ligase